MAKKKAAPARGHKETKEAVMGGEGGGAGNGTAPDPAADQAAKDAADQAAKDAAGKAKKAGATTSKTDRFNKAVDEAFAIHPMKRLFVTSDGQCFGDKHQAGNHARTLEVREVTTIERKDWVK